MADFHSREQSYIYGGHVAEFMESLEEEDEERCVAGLETWDPALRSLISPPRTASASSSPSSLRTTSEVRTSRTCTGASLRSCLEPLGVPPLTRAPLGLAARPTRRSAPTRPTPRRTRPTSPSGRRRRRRPTRRSSPLPSAALASRRRRRLTTPRRTKRVGANASAREVRGGVGSRFWALWPGGGEDPVRLLEERGGYGTNSLFGFLLQRNNGFCPSYWFPLARLFGPLRVPG